MQVFIKNSDDLKEIRPLKNDFMQTGMPDLSCGCAFKPEAGFQGCIRRLMLPGDFQRSAAGSGGITGLQPQMALCANEGSRKRRKLRANCQ